MKLLKNYLPGGILLNIVLLSIFSTTFLDAQDYKGFSYQGVLRNAENTLLAEEELTLILRITTDSLGYDDIYGETHDVYTSANGEFAVVLGEGDPITGAFENIDFTNQYFVKLEVDDGGGATQIGVSKLNAVPYSFVAGEAGKVTNTSLNELTDVSNSSADTGYVLVYNGSVWEAIMPNPVIWHLDSNNVYTDSIVEHVGIGIDDPKAPLHIRGGNWNLNSSDGDLKIGNDDFQMKMSVALGGGGSGHSRIFSQGGIDLLTLGVGTSHTLNIKPDRVGINTGLPSSGLHVYYNSSLGNPHLKIEEPTLTDYGRFTFANSPTNRFWTIAASSDTTNVYSSRINYYFYDGESGQDLFVLNGRGTFGINHFNPFAMLTIRNNDKARGGIVIMEGNEWWNIDIDTASNSFVFKNYATTVSYIDEDGNYIQVSDRNLKSDITEISHGTELVQRLRPVKYNLTHSDYKLRYGFIAQEVEDVIPEIVGQTDELKTLSYTELLPVAVKAIQEQQNEIQQLKDITDKQSELISDQEKRIYELEKRLNQLYNMLSVAEVQE